MDEKALQTRQAGELVLPLDRHPAAVYLAGLGRGSRRTMQQALDAIAALVSGGDLDALTFPWSELRYQHTSAIRARLMERYKPATVNKMLSALRGVLREAWKLRQISADDYKMAVSVEGVKVDTLPAGRDVSQGELSAMMLACAADRSPVGVRDAAIVGLLYACGLRRSELVKLDLADYDREAGSLHIREAKRNKERLVYPTGGAAEALADWLAIRGDMPGPLFVAVRKGGKLHYRRLTSQAVWKRVKRRAKLAGVKDLSPHDFRRTVAGDLLDAGADLVTVQKILGHSDPKTTARYDRRPEEAKRRAAQKLHVPYYRQILRESDD